MTARTIEIKVRKRELELNLQGHDDKPHGRVHLMRAMQDGHLNEDDVTAMLLVNSVENQFLRAAFACHCLQLGIRTCEEDDTDLDEVRCTERAIVSWVCQYPAEDETMLKFFASMERYFHDYQSALVSHELADTTPTCGTA